MQKVLVLICFTWSAYRLAAEVRYKRINCTTPRETCFSPMVVNGNISVYCIIKPSLNPVLNCLLTACQVDGSYQIQNDLCYCPSQKVDARPTSLYTCWRPQINERRHPTTTKSAASVSDNEGSPVPPGYDVVSETTEADSSAEENCTVTWSCVDCVVWTNICCWIQEMSYNDCSLLNLDLYQPSCCQYATTNLATPSPSALNSATVPSQLRLTVGLAVGIPLGVLLLVSLVVIVLVIRRRRRPLHAKDLDQASTAKSTTTNAYQTAPSLAPSAPTLYQDINDVSTTSSKQTTSAYEEPEPVVAQQRNEVLQVQLTPDKTPSTHDSAATYGDTTLIDNTLYNMDNNSTTCLATTSRDPTYSGDTTLIDNSLYRM